VRRAAFLLLIVPLVITACGDDHDDATIDDTSSSVPGFESTVSTAPPEGVLSVMSSAFADGEPIPIEYTCDGENLEVPLSYTGAPPETAAIAITVIDTDVNVEHLVRVGDTSGAPWFGPCPPEGDGPHSYVFTVHALDSGDVPATVADIDAHSIASASITGTYERG
jgi:phosphatidylethanolamine-binding protein (PEBP) family uncharacterized protein